MLHLSDCRVVLELELEALADEEEEAEGAVADTQEEFVCKKTLSFAAESARSCIICPLTFA
jgi:hypothetical protein